MKRRLLLLNLLLLAVLAAGVAEFRRQVRQAQERYRVLEGPSDPAEAPAYPAPAPPARVRQADYLPIVNGLLFSKDRNPIVEVEAPAGPEPVLRPEWPLLVGVMELGDGPIALMAADREAPAQPVAVGEKVGEFEFVANSGETMTLKWQEQTFEVLHSEMIGGAPAKPRVTSVARRKAAPPARSARNVTANDNSLGGKYNIGRELRPGAYAADPRDKSPDGTEYQSYVKRVRQTPFGPQAWWEQKKNTTEGKQ